MNFVPEPRITNRRTVTAQRLAQQRNKLLRARAALVQKIKRLMEDASEDVPEYSVHPADAGTDSFDRDLLVAEALVEQQADDVGLESEAARVGVPAHHVIAQMHRKPVVVMQPKTADQIDDG